MLLDLLLLLLLLGLLLMFLRVTLLVQQGRMAAAIHATVGAKFQLSGVACHPCSQARHQPFLHSTRHSQPQQVLAGCANRIAKI